ncbi:MAG: pyridoxamine 5'-phosphate oxidase family protein [Saprospiraceae bacterium]|nr:pyridoxamine 5'-phosphate oxidase family protein [Saprospiraceae bacterium]MCF8282142.1 pyridoxamine 5'-phosphate oxidase family protein [Bacteroidales bacterium]
MGKFSTTILPHHREFIEKQHLFFTASAPLSEAGHINLSPKGIDGFRVLSETQVGYMDFIGSGNETSAHVLENGRITFMFCAFDGPPNILRLYGKGRTVLPGTPAWEELAPLFKIFPATRQIIVADIDLVQTSCGYGVPLYEHVGERRTMLDWAEKKGEQGLAEYIQEKNLVSLDGLPTDWKVRES